MHLEQGYSLTPLRGPGGLAAGHAEAERMGSRMWPVRGRVWRAAVRNLREQTAPETAKWPPQ